LGKSYRFDRAEIARAVESLCSAPNISTEGPALEACLAFLKAGGDFADGQLEWRPHRGSKAEHKEAHANPDNPLKARQAGERVF